MAKKTVSRLGIGELEVLEMLWRDGPVGLSEAHAALGLPIGYTTVQTRLNRLVDKGVVKKSKDRPTQFSAAITREQVNRHDLDLLVSRVNEGEFLPLVAHLVGDRKLSPDEIDQLKLMIEDAEKNSSGSKRKSSRKGKGGSK